MEAEEHDEAWVGLVFCPRTGGATVEFCDFDGEMHRYAPETFLTEFADSYDHAELSAALASMTPERCQCCRWFDA